MIILFAIYSMSLNISMQSQVKPILVTRERFNPSTMNVQSTGQKFKMCNNECPVYWAQWRQQFP